LVKSDTLQWFTRGRIAAWFNTAFLLNSNLEDEIILTTTPSASHPMVKVIFYSRSVFCVTQI
jgi:hypothetical protein